MSPLCDSTPDRFEPWGEAMTSYQELIDEHEEIAGEARFLIDEISRADRANTTTVAVRLASLAALVERHVAKENALLSTVEGKAATAAWGHDWARVADSFQSVRERWGLFLDKWDDDRLATDWAEFRLEARSVFLRLQDQVMQETDLFYSSALREGAISLR